MPLQLLVSATGLGALAIQRACPALLAAARCTSTGAAKALCSPSARSQHVALELGVDELSPVRLGAEDYARALRRRAIEGARSPQCAMLNFLDASPLVAAVVLETPTEHLRTLWLHQS